MSDAPKTDTPGTDEAYVLRLLGRIADLERELAQAQTKIEELSIRHAAYGAFIAGADIPNTIESARLALVKRAEAAEARIAELEKVLTGWRGYAWKDGEYVDELQEFFDVVLKKQSRP